MIDEILNFRLPDSWEDIKNEPSWTSTLINLLSDPIIPLGHVPVLFAFRINQANVLSYDHMKGLSIIKMRQIYKISSADLAPVTSHLNWITELPDIPIRLLPPKGRKTVRPDLADLDFQTYLSLENLYQGYLHTKNDSLLKRMGEILYPRKFFSMRHLRRQHLFSCFFWFTSFKAYAAKRWSDFFVNAANANSLANPASVLRDTVDAQIRALTKGDISKENMILSLPCHRALTELNALARESAEIKRKLKN